MDSKLLAEYETKARELFNLPLPYNVAEYIGKIDGKDYLQFSFYKRGGHFGFPYYVAINPDGTLTEITNIDDRIKLHKIARAKIVYNQK